MVVNVVSCDKARIGKNRFISYFTGFVHFLLMFWTFFVFFSLNSSSNFAKCLFCVGGWTF